MGSDFLVPKGSIELSSCSINSETGVPKLIFMTLCGDDMNSLLTFRGSRILSQHSHSMISETTMLYKCPVTMIWLQCSIALSTMLTTIVDSCTFFCCIHMHPVLLWCMHRAQNLTHGITLIFILLDTIIYYDKKCTHAHEHTHHRLLVIVDHL